MTFFIDNGFVHHTFHRTGVHSRSLFEFTLYFYSIFTSLGFFYLTLHMIIDQCMEALDNILFFYAKYKTHFVFLLFSWTNATFS